MLIKISFVLPAYKARFLDVAIKSILSQTASEWELIIVDDCSPEDLSVIVKEYNDPRIHYTRNEINLGRDNLVKQWNHSISFAKGEWVILAADDDVYRPTFCEECIQLTEKYPMVDLIHSSVEQIDEKGRHLFDDSILPEYTSRYEYLNFWLRGISFTCIGNFMFRRKPLLEKGGFIDFPCAFGSDIATPIEMAYNGVANTQEMLFCFRQSNQHLSADSSRFKEKLKAISLLSEWIEHIDWPIPEIEQERAFYAIKNHDYLHKKCVYDYFNLVIKYLPLNHVLEYLKLCDRATFPDKVMMMARWLKRRLSI